MNPDGEGRRRSRKRLKASKWGLALSEPPVLSLQIEAASKYLPLRNVSALCLALPVGTVRVFGVGKEDKEWNTALQKAWRVFVGWCATNGFEPLPAQPEIVRAFLADHGLRWTKLDKLEATLDAIEVKHQIAGYGHPTEDPRVLDEVARRGAEMLALTHESFELRVLEVAAFAVAALELSETRKCPESNQQKSEAKDVARNLARKVLRSVLGREPLGVEVSLVLTLDPTILEMVHPIERKH